MKFVGYALAGLLSLAPMAALAQPSRDFVDTIDSKVLGQTRNYRIYLPKDYDHSGKSYPVLYVLHGMNGTENEWFGSSNSHVMADSLIALGQAQDLIIVAPKGGRMKDDGIDGYFDMEGWPFETFFFEEFMPYVEGKYRIKADKAHRAITGFSMGGGGAVAYAMHHPELFCAATGISGLVSLVMDLNGTPKKPEDLGKRAERKNDIGNPQTRKFGMSVITNDCGLWLRAANDARLEAYRTVAWMLDCGDEDFLLNANMEVYKAFKENAVPCEFRVRDGDHTTKYRCEGFVNALKFISTKFGD